MTIATKRMTKLLHPERWCLNGDLPDAYFVRTAERYLNHCTAYRKKTWFSVDGELASTTANEVEGSDSDVVYWRGRGKTGTAVSQLRFKIIAGRFQPSNGVSTNTIEIDITIAGGATTTYTTRHGSFTGTPSDAPNQIVSIRRHIPVDPETTYEVAIRGVDGGRPISVVCYEWADPIIDDDRNYYCAVGPGATFPIDDRLQQELIEGASRTWLANGASLLAWCGTGAGTAVSQTGTTWLNLIDGSSTSVSASTPGFYFDNESTLGTTLESLLPMCRLSAGNDLPVTIAAYANTSAGSTGEIRFHDGSTTLCSLGSIGTTLQWWSSDTVLLNVDTLAQMDLQLRNGTAGQTTNVYAVALYTR